MVYISYAIALVSCGLLWREAFGHLCSAWRYRGFPGKQGHKWFVPDLLMATVFAVSGVAAALWWIHP